jgi:hypothetical protein
MRSRDNHFRSRQPVRYFLIAVILSLSAAGALAQTSVFTYQGRLTDGGTTANGTFDMQFKLYDMLTGGTLQGTPNTITNTTVQVTSGVFTVQLDFGASAFPGADRFLEISVRHPGDPLYVTLSPRQQLTSTPYATRSANAASADVAINATQLGGVTANQFVQTTDARLSDARAPTVGSSNYIQNATVAQSGSNFNISGNGTAGGSLSGNIVNATTQYNIGGFRVLSNAGANNTFVGISAGQNNTGLGNTFVGTSAGVTNTTGGGNAFFGTGAGLLNTSGPSNAFFGAQAGQANTTGSSNSFVGYQAGISNTTASNNSFFGTFAGLFNSTGINNTFVGMNAGKANTTSNNNSFFGRSTGQANTTGANNSFFGFNAGLVNTTGGNNSFFGQNAGAANTSGLHNSFFGDSAGAANTASFNAFFGDSAGLGNTTGTANAFFGRGAGLGNTAGSDNSFFGFNAGLLNSGDQNSFFGRRAGAANTSGASNSFFGYSADVGSGALSNATAIGAYAQASQSNSLILGSISGVNGATADTFVGIGTTAPAARLEVNGQGGTALAITNGAIRVTGAGIGTNTAAFIHVKTAANTCGGALGAQIGIDNPMTNGDPNAILIITPRQVVGTSLDVYARVEAVYYPAGTNPCPFLADRWSIFVFDGSPVGAQFSVLVIKP